MLIGSLSISSGSSTLNNTYAAICTAIDRTVQTLIARRARDGPSNNRTKRAFSEAKILRMLCPQLRCAAGGKRMTAREIDIHTLPSMLTALRLPSFHKLWAEIATRADTEGWPAARFLAVLAEYELAERDMRRIRRHLNEAQLPVGKTLANFDFKALRTLPRARVEALAAGDWLDGGGNLIAIGNSGTGKTHILCAIGHALIETGHRVFYTRTSDLVQRLQAARRDLVLEAALAKLDKFDLIILDDITYAHKDQAETGVLFELIARRDEYRSIAIAADQPFSGWDQIFPDKAMTVAAIDRLVHHATILEMNAESFRQRAAATNRMALAEASATTNNDKQNEGET
ncbi:DNA replication protein [Puniceibacterium sp. IMCC21224]|nr:DNA replication protein [Puniceibacterium sp. IMCC21224]